MADQLLKNIQDGLEGLIDFEGQRLADLLTTLILVVTGVISFFAGLITQDIHTSLYTGLAGTALTFLLVVPPWPYFNKHPVRWLPARTAMSEQTIMLDGRKVN